jgi:hypothetical protein
MKYILPFVLFNWCFVLCASAQNAPENEKDSLLYIFQNKDDLLPLDRLDRTIFRTAYGGNHSGFGDMLNRFTIVPEISKDSISYFRDCQPNDVHIVSFMAPENDSIESVALNEFFQSLQKNTQ